MSKSCGQDGFTPPKTTQTTKSVKGGANPPKTTQPKGPKK